MEEMEKGKRYSAEDKGYTSKIYEIRWIPVTEREEYQEGPTRDALLKLKEKMAEKDFDKYIENGVIRVIVKSEIYRTMLMGPFYNAICEAFDVGHCRVVSQVNGY